MGFNPRAPKVGGTDFSVDSTLPIPDGSQPLHFPTAVGPGMAKIQDWIAALYAEVHAAPGSATEMLASTWNASAATGYTANVNGTVVADDPNVTVYIDVDLPRGTTLTAFRVRVLPAGGHIVLPTLPRLELVSIGYDGTQTVVATATDPSASIAAYELAHSISASGLSVTLDRAAAKWVMRFVSESGGGFVAGLTVYYPEATHSAPPLF